MGNVRILMEKPEDIVKVLYAIRRIQQEAVHIMIQDLDEKVKEDEEKYAKYIKDARENGKQAAIAVDDALQAYRKWIAKEDVTDAEKRIARYKYVVFVDKLINSKERLRLKNYAKAAEKFIDSKIPIAQPYFTKKATHPGGVLIEIVKPEEL